MARIGSLLVPCRARFWLLCTLGGSFWFVLGEINLLRRYFAEEYTCIDLASNFLQIFRMQIIFPRPGGGTIAAGNRDRACWGPRRKSGTRFVYSDSIRILGPNFGAHGPNPAARGWVHFGPPVAPVRFKRIGTKVWVFLRDRGLPSNVQRALCTVKAVSKTYRLPSARLRIAGPLISIHILGSWSPHAPNDTFRDHLKWMIFPSISGKNPMPTGGLLFSFDTLVSNIISFYVTWAHRFTICLAPFPN